MTIVGMIKLTELSNLAKEIKSQYTEIRELILDKMLDNMSKSDVERALGIKFGRSGFVIDFGVLADGSVALLEVHDGYSFGIYEPHATSAGVDVLLARWAELARR